jgi:hypothetical protein
VTLALAEEGRVPAVRDRPTPRTSAVERTSAVFAMSASGPRCAGSRCPRFGQHPPSPSKGEPLRHAIDDSHECSGQTSTMFVASAGAHDAWRFVRVSDSAHPLSSGGRQRRRIARLARCRAASSRVRRWWPRRRWRRMSMATATIGSLRAPRYIGAPLVGRRQRQQRSILRQVLRPRFGQCAWCAGAPFESLAPRRNLRCRVVGAAPQSALPSSPSLRASLWSLAAANRAAA